MARGTQPSVPDDDAAQPAGRASRPSWTGDRRSSPRITVEAELGFHSETNFFTGFAKDLSDGGLFIATYKTLPIGRRLTVNFGLPEGHEITAEGCVVWVREAGGDLPKGMGIRFLDLDDEAHAAIMRFIEERPPVFFES